jgi:hypothetical protein
MSLVRTVIVVGAVIALLPSDRAQQERLQQAVVDATQWTVTFCDRNAKTCDNAGVAWDVFKTKAEFAWLMGYDVVMSHVAHQSASAAMVDSSVETSSVTQQGTLTSRDLEPGWRGQHPRVQR